MSSGSPANVLRLSAWSTPGRVFRVSSDRKKSSGPPFLGDQFFLYPATPLRACLSEPVEVGSIHLPVPALPRGDEGTWSTVEFHAGPAAIAALPSMRGKPCGTHQGGAGERVANERDNRTTLAILGGRSNHPHSGREREEGRGSQPEGGRQTEDGAPCPLSTAWAAASRANGTRNPEQLT